MQGAGQRPEAAAAAHAALQAARERIADIDQQLMRLVGERLGAAGEVGAAKRALGLPVRNFETEAEVLRRFREAATAAGLGGAAAESLAGILIEAAVYLQEEAAGGTAGTASPLSVVIVGGAGRMGRWFRRFFEGQGHAVAVLDPALAADDPARAGPESLAGADVVLVATGLSATGPALDEVLGARPRGLVADIASLKSPIQERLRAAAASGMRVASLHPLFGPEVRTLGGRVMAVCDCGHPEAADTAAGLFADTAVTITRVAVEDHDRYMQYVLGLSHLASLLFATTAAQSGLPPQALAGMASTTWLKQVRTAAEVVAEQPRLYYEIQHLNRHSAALYAEVRAGLARLEAAAMADTDEAFAGIMAEARDFLPASPPRLLG